MKWAYPRPLNNLDKSPFFYSNQEFLIDLHFPLFHYSWAWNTPIHPLYPFVYNIYIYIYNIYIYVYFIDRQWSIDRYP